MEKLHKIIYKHWLVILIPIFIGFVLIEGLDSCGGHLHFHLDIMHLVKEFFHILICVVICTKLCHFKDDH